MAILFHVIDLEKWVFPGPMQDSRCINIRYLTDPHILDQAQVPPFVMDKKNSMIYKVKGKY